MKPLLGIFDSGVGGLTVLKNVLYRHGDLSAVYLADTARIPYGVKSPLEIQTIALGLVEWLNMQNISVLAVACNTTDSLAIKIVKQYSSVPVVGLIDSVGDLVFESRIGVLATPSTTESRAYTKVIMASNPNAFVIEQACPAFVPLIETGQINSNEFQIVAKNYLKPLIDSNVEAIILGCSHYPLLKSRLQELLPKHVRLIDPSIGLSQKLDDLIGYQSFVEKSIPTFCNVRFCATSDSEGFASRISRWLGIHPQVELVSVRKNACVF
ncbi:glutamate racemase [Prochlorococcus marinus]|uniref:Glutamate racemase n=1 Tax=Prochlorococcus marinus (strain MIT 9211) TaxID=93059 RepID=A9BAV1_PROM4|nr:glutamate racemase [Prochlorococcus marinus]ABX08963.1 Putative aspartate and glutamate racemases:Glutamate racemase [Prochlorococcus marinus str. MIT 9211]